MGFLDPKRKKLDKAPIKRENEGHTLSEGQVDDLRKIADKYGK